jgi:lipoprotein-releasing system ATP-binding protein
VNREDKATFLICTHDEGIADRCARRIMVKDGRAERVQG